MGATLGIYVGRAFLRWTMGIFGGVMLLILLVDLLELLRRASDLPQVDMGSILLTALFRLPSLGEQLFPFAVLFGSMAALLTLSRKLELVVARAAGISAWQFLTPGLVVTVGLGLFAILVYNPLAVTLKDRADRIEAGIFGRPTTRDTNLWLRQSGVDGQSVLQADRASPDGRVLSNVSLFVFDPSGRFRERVEAAEARLDEGYWSLKDAVVSAPDAEGQAHAAYLVSTNLTPEQVRESLSTGVNASFWSLPTYIALAEKAGLPALRYRLQYQTLLALPLLLAAMVFLAASVSMRLFRLGNVGKMILGGVVAGFALYVISKIAQDLGGSGFVSSVAAAWVPPGVAILLGITSLLHQEDG